jgi:hypothetical protein
MRGLLFLGFILMLVLPCIGQGRVRLKNGNVIAEMKLLEEHHGHITYTHKGSVHDVYKEKIEFIETDSTIIRFDENGQRVTVSRGEQRLKGSFTQDTLGHREESSMMIGSQSRRFGWSGNTVYSSIVLPSLFAFGTFTAYLTVAPITGIAYWGFESQRRSSTADAKYFYQGLNMGSAISSAAMVSLLGKVYLDDAQVLFTAMGSAAGALACNQLMNDFGNELGVYSIPLTFALPFAGAAGGYLLGKKISLFDRSSGMTVATNGNGLSLTWTF